MSRYIIERNVPGGDQFSADELSKIARKSVEVLESMATRIQWNESFVTGDKLFCIALEQVRQATAGYQDVTAAIDAGYVQFFGCVHEPLAGSMG